jgi:hypothetical protein
MRNPFSEVIERVRMDAHALAEVGSHLVNPTIRLGVTGMSGGG